MKCFGHFSFLHFLCYENVKFANVNILSCTLYTDASVCMFGPGPTCTGKRDFAAEVLEKVTQVENHAKNHAKSHASRKSRKKSRKKSVTQVQFLNFLQSLFVHRIIFLHQNVGYR